MAIQIFRQSGPTWAESLNAGLGQLAQNYNQQKQIQQQKSRMQQALQQLGYSSQEAAALGSLPEKLQFEVMKSLAQRPYVPGGAEFADQQAQAAPVAATEQFMEQPQAPEMSTQELASAAIKRSKTPYMFGIPDQTIEMMKMLAPSMQQTQEQQAQQDAQAQSQPQPAVMQQQQPAISSMQMQPSMQQSASIRQRLGMPTTKEQLEMEKIAARKEDTAKRREEQAFKITKELRKEVLEKGKAARQDLVDLDRLEELQKEGKLDTPGYIEFLKRSGLDIPALMNEGSEEFQKIAQNFMRNAKTYLGSRISNFELEQFLKTIPSLSQSPEGRKRVIANLRRISQAQLEHYNVLQDVMKENKNIPPLDLAEQIEDRVDKKMDKIAERFRSDLAREVPKGQNKLITALQAGLGTAVSRLPKAALGAGTGAYFGARFGVPGAIAGGVLGGLAGLGGIGSKDVVGQLP